MKYIDNTSNAIIIEGIALEVFLTFEWKIINLKKFFQSQNKKSQFTKSNAIFKQTYYLRY